MADFDEITALPSSELVSAGSITVNIEPAAYARGISAAKNGDHQQAIEFFRSCVRSNPDHPPSQANLGAALAMVGDYQAAITFLENAVRLAPDDVNSLANLAFCLHLSGHSRMAAEKAELVLVRNPTHQSALRTITVSCLAIGKARKALKGAAQLMRTAPSREAHQLLVRSLMAAGRTADAETEAQRYVAQMKMAATHAKLPAAAAARAIAMAELLKAQTIRASLETLKPTGPQLPLVRQRQQELLKLLLEIVDDAATDEACFQLARAYHDLHQHEQAEQALRKSVELRPDNTAALELLADVLIERSMSEEAVKVLDQTLAIHPSQSKALLMRVRTAANESDQQTFHSRLDEYLGLPNARPMDRINWHFAKGQLFDKAGDYQAAFHHYLEAGRLKEDMSFRPDTVVVGDEYAHPHDRTLRTDIHQWYFERSRQAYTSEFLASRAAAGHPSRRPIFVIGVPRSGTTLLEQILASHPLVEGAGELPEISSFAARCDQLTELCGGYPQAMSTVPAEMLAAFSEEYLGQLQRVSTTAERIVDKMPGNLIHVGLIHSLFPNASIVRIRRDPRDVCVSALKNHLDFPLCNLEKTARFCVACDRLSELWNDLLPGRILHIDYESLVTDLEPNIRRLLEHCELDWDERCLEFYRTDRNVRTPSRWQVRKPAYRSSIGAWKRYSESLTHLNAILGPPEI